MRSACFGIIADMHSEHGDAKAVTATGGNSCFQMRRLPR
jgi:hypothetical protein